MAEIKEELKSLLMKVKEESEKASLELNIKKTRITTSSPTTSWQIDGETMETMRDFIFGGAPKSLQMVTAAMKLKDTCSLEVSRQERSTPHCTSNMHFPNDYWCRASLYMLIRLIYIW